MCRRRTPAGERPSRYVVALEDVGGERYLPIWISTSEDYAMAMLLERLHVQRPLTYAFTANLLAAAGVPAATWRPARPYPARAAQWGQDVSGEFAEGTEPPASLTRRQVGGWWDG